MGVVITREDIRAYAEIDYIINHLNEKYREMVPDKLLKFFNDFKDPTIEIKVDPYVPLEKQGLQRYTLEILALLHLKYWCEDEAKKQELYEIMVRNQEKIEEQMNEKYNIDDLFAPHSQSTEQSFQELNVEQKYDSFTEKNNDIEDYTDHVDVEAENQKLPIENQMKEEKNIFSRIKEIFLSIFAKKKNK